MIAYNVARRVREIGILLALGAELSDLIKLILRQGAWIGISGLTIGTGAVWLSTRALSSRLFGVEPHFDHLVGPAKKVNTNVFWKLNPRPVLFQSLSETKRSRCNTPRVQVPA